MAGWGGGGARSLIESPERGPRKEDLAFIYTPLVMGYVHMGSDCCHPWGGGGGGGGE